MIEKLEFNLNSKDNIKSESKQKTITKLIQKTFSKPNLRSVFD